MRKSGPAAPRIFAASWPEAITPSKPHSMASLARCSTSSASGWSQPCSMRSAGARLVSTVTPSSLSALSPRPRTAAASVFLSSACTVRNATPMRAIAAVARSTVASMSSSLASTNTGTSRRASSCASAKPSAEQQLEPDLVDADAVAERLDQRFGLFDARHVERHDQSVAGKRHGTTKLLAATASASTTRCRVSAAPRP